MTYFEFERATIKALKNCDVDEIQHLHNLDGNWFDGIVETLDFKGWFNNKRWQALKKALAF